MKKIVALFLALALVLSLSAAVAEQRNYLMIAATDMDGNAIDITSEGFPILVFSIDDEAGVCAFGTEEEMAQGTFEVTEANQEEQYVDLHVVLEDESEVEIRIDLNEDMVYVFEPENNLIFILARV